MSDHDLPSDLSAMEQALAGRELPEPPAHLRQRVLKAIRNELHPKRCPVWGLIGAAAAAALLLINLSMSVANNMTWPLQTGLDRDQVEATADRIRDLTPGLSENEIRRQALALQATATTTPTFSYSPSSLPRLKDQNLWVTP